MESLFHASFVGRLMHSKISVTLVLTLICGGKHAILCLRLDSINQPRVYMLSSLNQGDLNPAYQINTQSSI